MTGQNPNIPRRSFLYWALLLFLAWPLLRFIGFKLRKKPVQRTITTAMPLSGVLVEKDFILFDRNGKSWALSRKCTHLGCSINYHETTDLLECPCHQSRFHVESGQVIRGPASRPLPRLPVEKISKDAGYVVTISS